VFYRLVDDRGRDHRSSFVGEKKGGERSREPAPPVHTRSVHSAYEIRKKVWGKKKLLGRDGPVRDSVCLCMEQLRKGQKNVGERSFRRVGRIPRLARGLVTPAK